MDRATRTEQLFIRLSPAEAAAVKRMADAAHLSPAVWARAELLLAAERAVQAVQAKEGGGT